MIVFDADSIWPACDIEGSYEETPPTLLDELKRDRRRCQGNMQHMRLIFTRGFFPVHRTLFLNGILTYGSALLWLTFLVVNSAQAVSEVLFEPIYMPILRKFLPPILQDLEDNLERPARYSPFGHSRKQGFLRAAVAPRTHALHVAMQLHRRKKRASPTREEAKKRIVEKALRLEQDALSTREKTALLKDTDRLHELHRRIWTLEDKEKAALWGLALPKE